MILAGVVVSPIVVLRVYKGVDSILAFNGDKYGYIGDVGCLMVADW